MSSIVEALESLLDASRPEQLRRSNCSYKHQGGHCPKCLDVKLARDAAHEAIGSLPRLEWEVERDGCDVTYRATVGASWAVKVDRTGRWAVAFKAQGFASGIGEGMRPATDAQRQAEEALRAEGVVFVVVQP